MSNISGDAGLAARKGRVVRIVGIAPVPEGISVALLNGDEALDPACSHERLNAEEAGDHHPVKGCRPDLLERDAGCFHPNLASEPMLTSSDFSWLPRR